MTSMTSGGTSAVKNSGGLAYEAISGSVATALLAQAMVAAMHIICLYIFFSSMLLLLVCTKNPRL
jgi:predicted membrane-bound spermidine synthase